MLDSIIWTSIWTKCLDLWVDKQNLDSLRMALLQAGECLEELEAGLAEIESSNAETFLVRFGSYR